MSRALVLAVSRSNALNLSCISLIFIVRLFISNTINRLLKFNNFYVSAMPGKRPKTRGKKKKTTKKKVVLSGLSLAI